MQRITITGGTGSLGSELARFYTKMGFEVVILSRDPHKQNALAAELPNARFILGDICDQYTVRRALTRSNYLVHAAALKHVNLGETNVEEFVRVNITGAQVVAREAYKASRGFGGLFRALFVSSDKACDPINLYGRTKAIGEDIFRSHGFSVIRYGNVVNSRGSVFKIWRDLLSNGKNISVRHPYPTRFALTIEHAINLVDEILRGAHIDGVFVPSNLRAFSLDSFIDAFDIPEDRVIHDKLLPGEKRDEILISPNEYGISLKNIVSEVFKGNEKGTIDREDYCSMTAKRMSRQELLSEFSSIFGNPFDAH